MNRCSTARLRGLAFSLSVLLLGGAAALAMPAGAGAAEGIYFSSGTAGSFAVETGSVTTEGATAKAIFESQKSVGDLALDPAAGDLFWTDPTDETIASGSLSGGTVTTPFTGEKALAGLAIAGGKLYWSVEGGAVEDGPLAGPTSTPAGITGAGDVTSVVVDGADLYLGNTVGEIFSAPIAGGAATGLFTGPIDPVGGIAIDAATKTIYWTDDGEVLDGPLTGGSPTPLDKTQAGVVGVALDPSTGKIYWAVPGEIRVGSLTAEGGTKVFSTTGTSGSLALLDAPVNTAVPTATGPSSPAVGSTLTCSTGTWAADLPESQLYGAPASYAYQWLRSGTAVKSATSSTLKVTEGGTYTCQVTATNAEGSTPATSTTSVVVPAPAPTVSISTPASGETYTQHETVATKFTCTEGAGGPGLASCDDSNGIAGTVSSTKASGAGDLNTANPGAYTYTVTVVSKDGDTASASVSYTVVPYAALESAPEVTITSLAKNEKSGKVAAKLTCEPGAACSGKLTLTAKVKVTTTTKGKKGKKGKSKTKTETLTLASGSYSLAAGKSETVELKLLSKALKVLEQAKTTKLTVDLKATVKGGTTATLSGKLTLTAPKAKKSKGSSGSKSKTGKKASKG